jgi:hypothetical protein
MDNQWVRLFAYVTGLVNQELLLQNEYLVAENRILKAHLQPRYRLTDSERARLAEIGKRLGHKALQKVANIAKIDTLLAWYCRLIAVFMSLRAPRALVRQSGRPPYDGGTRHPCPADE